MSRQSGLGRGLGALIPSAGPGETGLLNLRLSDVIPNPRQPRGAFDVDALEELAQSLREVGLLQPIIVRPVDGDRYEIVAGERRFRAARLAGLDEIPAVVRQTEDSQLLTESLVENIHRADLNPLEEAAAYQQLIDDFDVTHEALAARLGKSRSAISNALRLLTLPPSLQHKVAEGVLSAGHARALLPLASTERQERLAQRIIAEGLSVRATEDLVRSLTEGRAGGDGSALSALAQAAKTRKASPFEHLQATLGEALATRVVIKGTSRRGKVVIDYAGQQDLERLLEVVARGSGTDIVLDS